MANAVFFFIHSFMKFNNDQEPTLKGKSFERGEAQDPALFSTTKRAGRAKNVAR